MRQEQAAGRDMQPVRRDGRHSASLLLLYTLRKSCNTFAAVLAPMHLCTHLLSCSWMSYTGCPVQPCSC
jgi:hypothetical protein